MMARIGLAGRFKLLDRYYRIECKKSRLADRDFLFGSKAYPANQKQYESTYDN